MKFNRVIIRPYSPECGGARDIVKVLNEQGVESKRVFSKETSYTPEPGDLIVNWGASYPPDWGHLLTKKNVLLNHWVAVGNSVSKIKSFQNFRAAGVPTPEWTLSQQEALEWVGDGHQVCVRATERGYDGAGLTIAKNKGAVVWAPLYTKFIPGTVREYRAYIFKGELIDLLYKYALSAVKSNVIRTEANGWEYGRNSGYITKKMTDVARRAIEANEMDFGGVDIIEDEKGNYFALETNSEPGIGKITAQRFANAIRKEAGL